MVAQEGDTLGEGLGSHVVVLLEEVVSMTLLYVGASCFFIGARR
jgi:hypothetical protein